ELLEKAPFFNAIRSSLVREGDQAGEKYKVVIFETEPFTHPTPTFPLILGSEGDWFDLTGFAFRVRGGDGRVTYEPVPADLSIPGVVRLTSPPSEEGDRVFGVLRLSLKGLDNFPTNPTSQIHTATNSQSKENK